MTVAELIAALKELPPDAEVFLFDGNLAERIPLDGPPVEVESDLPGRPNIVVFYG